MDSLIVDSAGKARGATPRTTSKYSRQFMSLHYASSDQCKGQFFHTEHELATSSKYVGLLEWENKQYYAASSSIGK